MSYKKKRLLSYIAIASLVILAYICRQISFKSLFLIQFAGQCRSSIYIGLYCAWVIYLEKHVVDAKMRQCLTWIACLMVFWFLVRTIKFLIFMEPLEMRICWYLYYIPMILIPTLGLNAALLMDKEEGENTKKQSACLIIPALCLIFAVLTNDLHQKVFYFPKGFFFSNEVYEYRFIFILIQIWMMLCLMIMEVVLMRKSAASGRKWTWFPVLPGLLLLGWNLCHILGMPFIKAYVGDMTAVCCFLMAAIYQSSIICGLIPINSRYIELFQAAGGLDAEITDWSFKKCYHSGKFLDIPQEVRETLLVGTLVIENGTRMNHLLVRGGHLFWAEDVSLLMDQYQDIEEQQEELRERNRLLQKNYQQEAKRRKVEEQNRLLDLIQSQTAGQIELISHFMEELEKTESKEVYERLLGKIVVVGTYLKRRKNLTLTLHNEKNENREALKTEDLIQSLAESCMALKLCKIRALYYVNIQNLEFHDEELIKCYDYFEWLVEQLFDRMQMIFFRVIEMEAHLIISVNVISENDVYALLSGQYGAEVEQEDEKEWLIRCRIL